MSARKQRAGSLKGNEVGIIRNLLARGGYKNQDILGLINTVRRLEGTADTNGGRISDVKTGKPRYKGMKAAPDEETDEYGGNLVETDKDGRHFKVINTGTIDRYSTAWGSRLMKNAGVKYKTPYIDGDLVSNNRRNLYGNPKIIFAKMAKFCEAFLDKNGEFAALNVNCIHSPEDGISLEFITGYVNSKMFMFFYDQFFTSLRMSGGYYQFQSPQLRVTPIKNPLAKMLYL